jgi:hypothetical protein
VRSERDYLAAAGAVDAATSAEAATFLALALCFFAGAEAATGAEAAAEAEAEADGAGAAANAAAANREATRAAMILDIVFFLLSFRTHDSDESEQLTRRFSHG